MKTSNILIIGGLAAAAALLFSGKAKAQGGGGGGVQPSPDNSKPLLRLMPPAYFKDDPSSTSSGAHGNLITTAYFTEDLSTVGAETRRVPGVRDTTEIVLVKNGNFGYEYGPAKDALIVKSYGKVAWSDYARQDLPAEVLAELQKKYRVEWVQPDEPLPPIIVLPRLAPLPSTGGMSTAIVIDGFGNIIDLVNEKHTSNDSQVYIRLKIATASNTEVNVDLGGMPRKDYDARKMPAGMHSDLSDNYIVTWD